MTTTPELRNLSPLSTSRRPCRLCGHALPQPFLDLGMSPLCESFVSAERLNDMEAFYPLRVHVCPECFLVQLDEYVPRDDIFSDYAYFSSYSTSWVDHARRFADTMSTRLGLGASSLVIEAASNDGYLLQHFVKRGIPVLGIEPAANVAAAARERSVPTEIAFLGADSAIAISREYGQADLLVGNNVIAQVPDLHDFVAGLASLLKPDGTLTLEFPHLLRLFQHNQFDTIYHEHFSYFTVHTITKALNAHGLSVAHVDEIPTHGGSLRVFAGHRAVATPDETVERLYQVERSAGLLQESLYEDFSQKVMAAKRSILSFLIDARNAGRTVAGYGAPGKANTLLNYCGIRSDLISYTVDRNPFKQGMYLPGTHIPILHPDTIEQHKPDYLFIMPWNLKDEIVEQMSTIRQWGGRFVVPIPTVEVL
jgi:SAM-dependent methyltransferase